jgi:hypothetical protein
MDDFIEVYPDAVPAAACRQMVAQFEASGQAAPGRTSTGVDVAVKNSSDITISGKPEWQAANALLQKAAFDGLKRYVKKYPFLLIGPLALRLPHPTTGEVMLLTADTFPQVTDEQFRQLLFTAFRPGAINLQKYLAGRGGYPHWHSEITPRLGNPDTMHRVLLFTVYLNDVPEAGETEFVFQNRKIAPKTGSLLLAPAGFTHTHRGNTPVGGDKYIATSWILFQRAETLYGGGK